MRAKSTEMVERTAAPAAVAIEELWTADETAKFLRVSRPWVYMRAEAGLLPHLRVGGLLRFEPATIKAFIRQDRVSSTEALARLNARR